jgi:phosphoribosylaminoimidazolecarboxamide formyltransferase/IMP cyclohydrolase
MQDLQPIQSALISVYDKSGLEPLLHLLNEQHVKLYSTGGTQEFIEHLGLPVHRVEDLTSYPSILGGRVKTLHPNVFGGILARRDNPTDHDELNKYAIPTIDLVIVDLYPFEETVASGATHEEIIEKIDIGGISLIRAGAKNYKDVVIVSSKNQYSTLVGLLENQEGKTTLDQRKVFAEEAFKHSSIYDLHIHKYFNSRNQTEVFELSAGPAFQLRYGENPHQKGTFYGDLHGYFDQLNGKELSYNNLLDIDAAVQLAAEFSGEDVLFAILKHNNPCGIAVRTTVLEAYQAALSADPVSAFGGILICSKEIDEQTATEMNDLFCEVVIAPSFSDSALEILRSKKNRILLKQKGTFLPERQVRSVLNGLLVQDRDITRDADHQYHCVTKVAPQPHQKSDLLFANRIVKHVKSNTIVLVKNNQMLACGTGQTSRVDALQQAIHKAQSFQFDLKGAVMASDAFFPFPDCVEIAHKAGIEAVIQPGGSIKDELSITYCDNNEMSMIFTGIRHFKH